MRDSCWAPSQCKALCIKTSFLLFSSYILPSMPEYSVQEYLTLKKCFARFFFGFRKLQLSVRSVVMCRQPVCRHLSSWCCMKHCRKIFTFHMQGASEGKRQWSFFYSGLPNRLIALIATNLNIFINNCRPIKVVGRS